MVKENRAETEGSAVAAPAAHNFDVALKLQAEGTPVLHEPVLPADHEELYAEAWLGHLRLGHPGLTLEDLLLRALPVTVRQEESRCDGLVVEATAPNGETVSRRFGLDALAHVAARGAARLLQSGALQPNQNYYYEIVARQSVKGTIAEKEPSREVGGSFSVRRPPLTYLEHPLPPLLAQADAVGPVEGWSPIFYSHDAFIRADGCSRRGAAQQPPEESGAVILGQLCSCPETGEFYTVATDVIELEDAEQKKYSLAFSSKTWGRIQSVVKSRQANPASRAVRLVGQCHGHNFYPCMLEEKDCQVCEKRETCRMTSVFVSEQDQLWTRAVFVRQPWGFCHVFGLDARGNPVHGQFGFQGGRMVQRGFHLIPELPASLKGDGRCG